MSLTYDSPIVNYDSTSFTYDGGTMFNGATIQARALIGRRQGWPIPEITDPAYSLFTPTQLNAKARILGPTAGSQTAQSKAAIFRGGTMTITARGRVVLSGSVQAKAYILGNREASLLFQYRIQTPRSARFIGAFFLPGRVVQQTVGARAKVAGVHQKALCGYFLVVSTPSSNIQRFDFVASPRQSRIVTARAFIV